MSALKIEVAEPSTIALASITRDPELLCRATGVDAATVAEYHEAMQAGAVFPAVVVFGPDSKGAHWLADGFHRCAAAELAGLVEVAADVRAGSKRDALLYAAGANAAHGLRRTNADKRRAVLLVLAACPKWSDRKIGEACGVSHPFVAGVRRDGVVTVTTGDGAEPASPGGPPVDWGKLAERLAKAFAKGFEACPAEHRAALRAQLLRLLEEVAP